jgi:hypothetical protein
MIRVVHPGSRTPDPGVKKGTGSGSATLYRTCLMQVKVLGTLAMVDDGEADWKMIVIGGDC